MASAPPAQRLLISACVRWTVHLALQLVDLHLQLAFPVRLGLDGLGEVLRLAAVDAASRRTSPSSSRPSPTGSASCRCRSCLLYTSPSPRDGLLSRMPSSA